MACYIMLTTRTMLFVALFITTPTKGFLSLTPSDVSVPENSLLPLSCVSSNNQQVSWFRNDQLLTNTNETLLTFENFTSSSGTQYTIWTLILCNVNFQQTGLYGCSMGNTDHSNTFNVKVQAITKANFQLVLVGMNNCREWNPNNSVQSNELISQIKQSALHSVCTTQSQQCSYDIINPSFECCGKSATDEVVFTSTVVVQCSSSSPSITADDVIALIEIWKNVEDQRIILNSQVLHLEKSFSTNTSTSWTLACNSTLTEQKYTNWIVGGAVIGIVVICSTMAVIAVITSLYKKKSRMASRIQEHAQVQPRQQHTAHSLHLHTSFSNPNDMEVAQASDILNENIAYGHRPPSSNSVNTSHSQEGSQIDMVEYTTDVHHVYDDIVPRPIVPLTSEDEIYDDEQATDTTKLL